MVSPNQKDLPVIGWREWLELPDFGVAAIKAKIDTGARSSSLHAFDMEFFKRRGKEWARFKIYPFQRDARHSALVEAEVLEWRYVRSSGGHVTCRPIIMTRVRLLDLEWSIEVSLVSRDEMGFRMLLGRSAVKRRFLIDPCRSFRGEKERRRSERREARRAARKAVRRAEKAARKSSRT